MEAVKGTEVRSARWGDKGEEIGVKYLQFGEEIQTLILVPMETDSSFTALLDLPANQAVKLLHSPEPEDTTATLSGEVWNNRLIEHAKPYHCTPIFPSNAALIARASKFSVFAATGNSPETSSIPSSTNGNRDKVKQEPVDSDSHPNSSPVFSDAMVLDNDQKSTKRKEREKKVKGSAKKSKNVANESLKDGEKLPYVHVRARRGQATDNHSLSERARREKINARMKLLQELVPGCNKISGTAMVLDEIINHVQSLQRQVEFLSMRLAAVNPRIDVNLDSILAAETSHAREDFQRDSGHAFEFDHCYEILKELPKFNLATTTSFMEDRFQSQSNTESDDHIDVGDDVHEMHTPLKRLIRRSGEKRKAKKNATATTLAAHTTLLENSEKFTNAYNANAAQSRQSREELNVKLDTLIDIRRMEYENTVIYADTTHFNAQQMVIHQQQLAKICRRRGI